MKINLDGTEVTVYDFKASVGSDTTIILICVFSILGALLIIGVVIFIVVRRKRRKNLHQTFHNSSTSNSTVHNDDSYNVDVTDDAIWTNVDLNSPTIATNENTFFNNQGYEEEKNDNADNESEVIDFTLMTSLANDNFHNNTSLETSEDESHNAAHDDDDVPTRAVVAVGGGADVGAGQLRVQDYEVHTSCPKKALIL